MFNVNEKAYKPPYITERDELVHNDCTICATLMATGSATLGRTVMGDDWRPLSAKELKRRREQIRNEIPGDKDVGGTSMADMRVAFGRYYPDLPDLVVTFYDVQKPSWDTVVSKLKNNGVGVLQGDPSQVKNENSKLRRWTNNDHFGHAIYADRAKTVNGKDMVFIMDPMGMGNYDGEWIDAEEVHQYMYKENGYVKASMFVRGLWSPEKLAAQDMKDKLMRVIDAQNNRISDMQKQYKILNSKLTVANKKISDLEEQLAAVPPTDEELQAQLLAMTKERDEVKAQLADLENQFDDLDEQFTALSKKWDEAGAALDNLVDVYGE